MSGLPKIMNLVEKRRKALDVFKAVHSGDGILWMGLVQIGPTEARASLSNERARRRIKEWFTLGLSLGSLLGYAPGANFVRQVVQLLIEYSYFIADSREQASMRSKAKERQIQESTDREKLKGSLVRDSQGVYFEVLQVPGEIPAYVDYCKVVVSMCTVLTQVYSKFMDEHCYEQANVCEAAESIDKQLCGFFFEPLAAVLGEVASHSVKKETGSVANVLAACQTEQ
ncbi:MAG: hypothetical protein EZS28_000333 [Streblomastix strix]|uniref:Uncharacterized protein n=1 Tax=Streblomastix strix TaxID=222440 RepID=A0A5J4XAH8_9EUKA|nr:MAG: hypothetical protein EZS28_000333 [Streblomastix strix]